MPQVPCHQGPSQSTGPLTESRRHGRAWGRGRCFVIPAGSSSDRATPEHRSGDRALSSPSYSDQQFRAVRADGHGCGIPSRGDEPFHLAPAGSGDVDHRDVDPKNPPPPHPQPPPTPTKNPPPPTPPTTTPTPPPPPPPNNPPPPPHHPPPPTPPPPPPPPPPPTAPPPPPPPPPPPHPPPPPPPPPPPAPPPPHPPPREFRKSRN